MSEVIVFMSVVKFVCHLKSNVSNSKKYFSCIIKIPDFNKNIRVPVATLSIPSCLYCVHTYSLSFDQVQKAKYGMALEGFVLFLSEIP